MTKEDLIKIGFKPAKYYNVMNSVFYDLGRNRHLSAGNVGTPNEILFIYETDENFSTEINELICLHNYDYDGSLTIEKVQAIINAIKMNSK